MVDERTRHAVLAAAKKFDWAGLEQRMDEACACGLEAYELWGEHGCDDSGERPTWMLPDNPCPSCRNAVRPFVEAALSAADEWERRPSREAEQAIADVTEAHTALREALERMVHCRDVLNSDDAGLAGHLQWLDACDDVADAAERLYGGDL